MVRRTGDRHTGLVAIGCALALLALGAGGADAAKVAEVRVGTHEKQHTRIVLELDSFTGYRLIAPQPGEKPELVVNLEASSTARDVPSKSPLVRKVHVEPSGTGSTVRVQLATADVAVKEMLLSDPPRLVFDLQARGPIPKAVAAQQPEEPSASVEPVAVAVAEPAPAPSPPPAPAKVEAPRPAEPVAVAAVEEPVADPVRVPVEVVPAPSPVAESSPAPEPAPRMAEPIAPPAAPSDAQERRQAVAAKAKAETGRSEAGWMDMLMSPIGLGAMGGVVLFVVVVSMMRRRRAQSEEDALYTVMAADDAGASADASPAYASYESEETAVMQSSSPPPATSDWDAEAYEASEPAFKYASGPRQLALGARPEPEPEMHAEPAPMLTAAESDSIFGNDPVSEPSQAEIATATIPVPVIAPQAPPAAPAVSAEMERRLAELERRLEQLTEARERLERQVAAQTEELRVQRAAIARTQRVVRSIAKTEDVATEPVPRAPSA